MTFEIRSLKSRNPSSPSGTHTGPSVSPNRSPISSRRASLATTWSSIGSERTMWNSRGVGGPGCAASGSASPSANSATDRAVKVCMGRLYRRTRVSLSRLGRRARYRVALAAVRLAFELHRAHEVRCQVTGIRYERLNDEILIAVALDDQVVVFRHERVLAERHSVLAQIPRAKIRRVDFQAAGALDLPERRRARIELLRRPRELPRCGRPTLPAARALRFRLNEMKQARLHSGVDVELQRVVVLPADLDAARQPHDRGRRIALALLAGSFVARGIPRVGD